MTGHQRPLVEVPPADDIIALALAEDLGVDASLLRIPGGAPDLLDRDVTSAALVPADAVFEGRIVLRSEGVLCGLPIAARVWEMLSSAVGLARGVEVEPLLLEGTGVSAGIAVARVSGPARAVLAGERSALNALMVLSGVATTAARWQAEAGDGLAVVDTRKTLPGLRGLSKYAVRIGGAHNHRVGLYDMVLVKDNHIRFAGSIAEAVVTARTHAPGLRVQVEADAAEQAIEAVAAGADMLLLDNMDDAALKHAIGVVREVAARRGAQVLIEASGSVAFERLAALREVGVDRVSTSALTLAPPLDYGLDEG
ncbi:MAG: carboxylating nicotinate-nucleotide diphosphorylase [Actinobacteria bacterium]|nr:carboxylating nicotinate-nucleotide diphosphorylase [Actinomycetota bacterium]